MSEQENHNKEDEDIKPGHKNKKKEGSVRGC